MKRLNKILAVLLLLAIAASMTGCYMVSGQKMDRVKGTYKLTRYTYIPQHERKEGYTATTRNYIEDDGYKYEDYLIVTGTSRGYYVHKEADEIAYAKEITLSYGYSAEDSSKVEYVTYNDSLTVNYDSGINKLGVTKNSLNYSKAAFDYTQLITKKKMRSEDISVRWERVDKATDLSYVKEQLGEIKTYNYDAFKFRGVYELSLTEISTGNMAESDKQYFFYVIDTADGKLSAKAIYATKDDPTSQIVKELNLTQISADWSEISIDGDHFAKDPMWDTYYYCEKGGIKQTLTCVGTDISKKAISSHVESRLPRE